MSEHQTPTSDDSRVLKVVSYGRVGLAAQTRDTVETQLAAIEEHVQARGWTIGARYEDEASGFAREGRQLRRALEDAANGEFDVLVVDRLSRLSRNPAHVLSILRELERCDVRLASASEPIDTGAAIDWAVVDLLTARAQRECNAQLLRVRRAIARRVGAGFWMGQLPVGMQRGADGRLVADPVWVPVIQGVFTEYVEEHRSRVEIAHRLNDDGRTPSGAGWTSLKVMRILRCPAYAALQRWNDTLLPADHAALVDPTLWHRAQQLLNLGSKGQPQPRSRPSRGSRR
jgi:site-specific DNA recombinase